MIKKLIILTLLGLLAIGFDFAMATITIPTELFKDSSGIYMLRPEEGSASRQINLSAVIEAGESDISKSYTVSLDPRTVENKLVDGAAEDDNSLGEMSREELIAYEMRGIISSLNDNTSFRKVKLPDRLSSGEKIEWSIRRNTNTAAIAFATVTIGLLLYFTRNQKDKKRLEAEQDDIARQLPEFINRLVLLLNAGLVLNTAFERAIERKVPASPDQKNYFYEQMNEILCRIRQTNGSVNNEFREFARSRRGSGGDISKELMRISNIISDNISKGVELTDKLQQESEILWLNRKRNCEERGRIAETRLTFPLTLFLLVLIVITVSPALLEL